MKYGLGRFGSAVLLMLIACIACAQGGISVTINGEGVQFANMGPEMVNGRVLVPLRGVFEKLGARVEWHPERREVIATRGSNVVDLIIGNPTSTVNGQSVTLDVPAQIVNGSTMVPIRFVSESIGAEVSWQEAQQTVVITMAGDQPTQPAPPPADTSDNNGPIRMARVSYLDGGVMWRPGDDVDWSDAGTNLPLRQGAQFWLNPNSKGELQFDDGSLLRLGNSAVSTLQTMYSDSNGEFTEVSLNSGTATLHLTSGVSSYQVDTPLASITAVGRANFRIDATDGLRLIVRSGQVQVQGDAGQVSVSGGQFLRLADTRSSYSVVSAPGNDSWDQFCDNRDQIETHPSQYLPSSIALVGGDLDHYGSWVRDPQYGYCWHPTGSDSSWAPYRDGHWVWVSPFGWTWCGNEAWGWAPYHYGTWFPGQSGWLWRPGPAQQSWSPAVVYFSTDNGSIAWAPLSPAEVRYPAALSVGFRSGNWAVNFSIGGAATYYPGSDGLCTQRPWRNTDINHTTNVYNVNRVTNIQNVTVNTGFVPRNARQPGGTTVTTVAGFAGRGKFTPSSGANTAIFSRGKTFAPPSSGGQRFAGPTNVRPTSASFSPARALTSSRPNPKVANRTVVRAPLPAQAKAWSGSMPSARAGTGAKPVAQKPNVPTNKAPRVPTTRTQNPKGVAPPPAPNRHPTPKPVMPKPPVQRPVNPRIPRPTNPRPVAPTPPPPAQRPLHPRPRTTNPRPISPNPSRPVVPPTIPPATRPRPVPPPAAPVRPTTPARVNPRQRVPPQPNRDKTPPKKAPPKKKRDDKSGGQTTGG